MHLLSPVNIGAYKTGERKKKKGIRRIANHAITLRTKFVETLAPLNIFLQRTQNIFINTMKVVHVIVSTVPLQRCFGYFKYLIECV